MSILKTLFADSMKILVADNRDSMGKAAGECIRTLLAEKTKSI